MINYNAIATILFGGLVDKYSNKFDFLKESLPRANIKIPFRTYLSTSCLNALVIYFFSLGFISILLFTFFEVQLLHKILLLIYLPLVFAVITFVVLIIYPYQKVMSRKKNIDTNLPFALSHMGAISESGLPPYMVFKLLSKFKEYDEITKEMEKLVRNTDTYGIDPLTAIKELADKTPSERFRQILLGIVSTTESGGDIKTYLKNAGTQALFDWKLKREKFMQQLSAYAEFYTGILIAAPLFIIALFSVMNMIQPNIAGFDILTLTKLSIYILIPFLNIGFIAFLRGVEVEM